MKLFLILLLLALTACLMINSEEYQPISQPVDETQAVQALLGLSDVHIAPSLIERIATNRAKIDYRSPNIRSLTTELISDIPVSTIQFVNGCTIGVVPAPIILEPFFGKQVSRALSLYKSHERFTIRGYRDATTAKQHNVNVLTSAGMKRAIKKIREKKGDSLLIELLNVIKERLEEIDSSSPECALQYLEMV